MRQRPLGNSGIDASVIAFGAWAIGGWRWGGEDEDESVRAIHAAIDAGINIIDTAPVYGFGRSEEVIGKAIAGRRDAVVIATKCGLVWDRQDGELFFACAPDGSITPDGEMKIHKFLGPDSIKAEVDRSLQRLGVDHIDLLQTHWQDVTTPIADSVGAMLELKEAGKVRAIGACNATLEQLEAYQAAGALDTDQERYSMLDRNMDEAQLPWCKEHNVAVLAYSPLVHGLLTGKITPDREFKSGDLRSTGGRFTQDNRVKVAAMLAEFAPLTQKHGVTLAQLAVAWTVSQPGLTHALVGARNPKQAQENAAAGSVELDAEDLETIAAVLGCHAPGIDLTSPVPKQK